MRRRAVNRLISFHDSAPDERGRRHFTLWWRSTNVFTGEPAYRAQCFHAVPAEHKPFAEFTRAEGETLAQTAKRMLGLPKDAPGANQPHAKA